MAVIWLPKYLEQSEGNPIKELEGAPSVAFSEEGSGQVVTRFPTRSFGSQSKPNNPNPETETGSEAATSTGPGGLPTRFVPGVDNAQSVGDRVTTRAYLRADSSVFSRPSMTAEVLGKVDGQTKVRWLAKAGDGWEEILLKNGQSAYVQSGSMSFSADTWSTHQKGFQNSSSDNGPDAAKLPGTVESFLAHLSAADLLRAETFLSPVAPRLEQGSLGELQSYVGAPPLGRVLRIELISGDRASYRRVRIVYGPDMLHEASTVWEWDQGQQRWMLVRW